MIERVLYRRRNRQYVWKLQRFFSQECSFGIHHFGWGKPCGDDMLPYLLSWRAA